MLPRGTLQCGLGTMLNNRYVRKKCLEVSLPNTRIHACTQRSMISETNIIIGFDTLSESDTRGEERAYRLAQWGSKELVKSELFPAERRKNSPPSFVLADPKCSLSDFNRSQRSRSSHFLDTPHPLSLLHLLFPPSSCLYSPLSVSLCG